jgi:nucleotide-binding universal stress UspA family protein
VAHPILIAYDGSDVANAALARAAELFPDRPAIVVTVWEPGLAVLLTPPGPDPLGATMPVDPRTVAEVDSAERDHAARLAEAGAERARSLGLAAEPHAVPDEVDVAETVVAVAGERDAVAVVVGSHGISGLRARFLGSVPRRLLEHCDRPVLVVRS